MSDSVSVIVPAFNADRFLAEAVASVRQQGDLVHEVLLVDDGSTDNTRAIAHTLDGVQVICQKNTGPAAARNAGIRAASGDYLAFLDADDLWPSGKLAAQLAVLRGHSNIHLVAGHVEEFYADGAPDDVRRQARHSGDHAYTVGALLVRRTDFLKVGFFNETLRFGEFMDWRSRAINLGLQEYVLDQIVLRRRLHEHNTTRLARDHQRHYLATVRAHLERRRTGSVNSGDAP